MASCIHTKTIRTVFVWETGQNVGPIIVYHRPIVHNTGGETSIFLTGRTKLFSFRRLDLHLWRSNQIWSGAFFSCIRYSLHGAALCFIQVPILCYCWQLLTTCFCFRHRSPYDELDPTPDDSPRTVENEETEDIQSEESQVVNTWAFAKLWSAEQSAMGRYLKLPAIRYKIINKKIENCFNTESCTRNNITELLEKSASCVLAWFHQLLSRRIGWRQQSVVFIWTLPLIVVFRLAPVPSIVLLHHIGEADFRVVNAAVLLV